MRLLRVPVRKGSAYTQGGPLRMHNGFLIAKVGELQRSDANWVLSEKDGFGHTQRRHFRPFLLHAEIRSHRNPKNGFLFVKTGSLSKNLARMGSFCKFLYNSPHSYTFFT